MKYKYRTDIQLLISELNLQYKNIDELIHASFANKLIPDKLKIKVKHFLGDAQSILDYSAHEVADYYGIASDRIYFPIVNKQRGFEGSIGRNLPGLKLKAPKLFDYLEKIQPYNGRYFWLGDLASISNKHKHMCLIPQRKTVTHDIEMEHNGMIIKLVGKKTSLNLPEKSSLFFGDAPIYEGQKITPDLQPNQISCDERINIKRQIWKDLIFDKTDISVLRLIEKVNKNLPTIIDDIYKFLGS